MADAVTKYPPGFKLTKAPGQSAAPAEPPLSAARQNDRAFYNNFANRTVDTFTMGLSKKANSAARAVVDRLLGYDKRPFSEAYDEHLSDADAALAQYDKENPIMSKVATGVGIAATAGDAVVPMAGRAALRLLGRGAVEAAAPAAGAATRATLGNVVKEGAKTGAVFGAASGAGEADGGIKEHVIGAAEGALEGAGLGAAGGAVLHGIPAAGKGIVRKIFGNRETAENVSAMNAEEINATLQAAGTSRTAAGLHRAAATAPFVDDAAAAAAKRTLLESQQATERAAGRYGESATGRESGQVAKDSLRAFEGERPIRGTIAADDARMIKGQKSNVTGFKVKENALYSIAEREMPRGRRYAALRAQQALADVTDPLRSNPGVSAAVASPGWDRLRGALAHNNRLSFGDLRKLRTRITDGMSDPAIFEGVGKQELKHIAGALTQDLQAMARNAGPRAERAWTMADRYHKAGINRFDKIVELTGAKTPEDAYGVLLKAAQGGAGKGNLGLLQAARKSMSPQAWDEIAATMIREMGQPTAGATLSASRAAPGEFSPHSFITNIAKMSDQSRALLFGSGPRREAIDRLAKIFGNEKAMGRLANFSNSANQAGRVGWIMGGITAIPLALKGYAGAALINKLMTSPRFANWVADGYRITPGNPAAVARHIARLGIVARGLGMAAGEIQALQGAFQSGAAQPTPAQGKQP